MRRLAKFLHTMGAIGFAGAILVLLVLLAFAPAPEALAEYTAIRTAMDNVARWIFLPSLVLVLISGFLAIALSDVYKNAGWAWLKLATGVLVFEWVSSVSRGRCRTRRRSGRAFLPEFPIRPCSVQT
jgi:O-antigen/teichoic acid export membrane protein